VLRPYEFLFLKAPGSGFSPSGPRVPGPGDLRRDPAGPLVRSGSGRPASPGGRPGARPPARPSGRALTCTAWAGSRWPRCRIICGSCGRRAWPGPGSAASTGSSRCAWVSSSSGSPAW